MKVTVTRNCLHRTKKVFLPEWTHNVHFLVRRHHLCRFRANSVLADISVEHPNFLLIYFTPMFLPHPAGTEDRVRNGV